MSAIISTPVTYKVNKNNTPFDRKCLPQHLHTKTVPGRDTFLRSYWLASEQVRIRTDIHADRHRKANAITVCRFSNAEKK